MTLISIAIYSVLLLLVILFLLNTTFIRLTNKTRSFYKNNINLPWGNYIASGGVWLDTYTGTGYRNFPYAADRWLERYQRCNFITLWRFRSVFNTTLIERDLEHPQLPL